MKIDELIRDTMVKMEPAAKGKVEAGISASPELGALLADSMPDADFFFPDLLQAFGKLLSRRQELLEVLPQSVQSRLPETPGSPASPQTIAARSPESAPTVNPSFPQGVSGLARDSRIMTDTLRQMISELEFVERVPDLARVYEGIAPKLTANLLNQENASSAPLNQVVGNQQSTIAEKIPEIVKATLLTMQGVVEVEQVPATPANYFIRQAVQSSRLGQLAPEFAEWVNEVASTLEAVAETPEMAQILTKWENQADPRVLRLAQTADKPEIVRAWAAVQTAGELTQTAPTALPVVALSSGRFSVAGQTQPDNLDSLRSVVQKIIDLPIVVQAAAANSQPVPTSQVGRFELLLSIAAVRPDLLDKLTAVLPEMLLSGDVPKTERAIPPGYQSLVQAAPKWLKAMAEREEKPALLQFWVAAKMVDLGPWLNMEPLERQQLTAVLKELSATYEQPEAFRTPREDTSSRSFMMQIPLYAPGQETPYPALIQVFEEKKERGNGQLPEQEVWVRVSLETDHIGTVDLSFRLQDKKYLSIFSRFANPDAASEFRASLPELRKEMAGTSLELKKIAVAGRIHPGGAGNG